ncbi:TonB-dependent receptor [Iodidimonas sp. SYSU 1G8]|uniref:TonB-dependent receptor n=1 Tax=Iodidimonas sp. SYSU 1G8 TaxID=3133967 RepID=UPI0031FF0069
MKRKTNISGNTRDGNTTRRALNRLAATSALILIAPFAQPAWAQETQVADAAPPPSAGGGSQMAPDSVIVTAQRREENILKVPLSVTSYSPEIMDKQGVRDINDISRLTPSLRFTRTAGVAGNNGANISIRGVFSDVGSATTAIYIDETPIQIRSVGYFSGNPYPRVFDLDRVEVLRGPQGTLFGAGAMGGAVRFITKQPSFSDVSIYGRSEISTTKNGSESYEAGAALGMPINDKVAFQASAWYRHDGGYIDRVAPVTQAPVEKDINSEDTYAARLAFGFRPTDNLTITPSIYYQRLESEGRDQYWEQYTDTRTSDYKTGIYNSEPSQDEFYLAAVKIEYDLDSISIISNTSYFDRDQSQTLDYITYLSSLRSGNPFGFYGNKDPSNGTANQDTGQQNFTQEIRIQSTDTDAFISWLVGGYYSNAKQWFQNLSESGRIPGTISAGFPQYLGRYNLIEQIRAKDEQFAGFGSIDVRPTDALKLTAGFRYTKNTFDFWNLRDGPTNSGVETIDAAIQKGSAFTPRFVASYDLTERNMLYAAASKGFRQGGGQRLVDPNFCAADLATLGLTQSPRDFQSDTLWSYEVGTKNSLMNGKLVIDINAFMIKWKNIQQVIRLPTCSFSFVANLGNATAKGVDASISYMPFDGLTLNANLGYNQNKYNQDVFGGNGLLLRGEGDYIGGPNFTGSVSGQYDFDIGDGTEGYIRADYSFAGKNNDPNPLVFGYDANLPALGSTHYVSMRAGVRFSNIDLSVFVDNLTNTKAPLSRSHDTLTSSLYYVESYRPMTVGLTVHYRY